MSRGALYVIGLVLLVALIGINGAVVKPSAPAAQPVTTSARPDATDIDLPLRKGQPAVPLSSMRGKVVLLDFWATWCGPCRMSIPDLEKLYQKYHSKGLEVIGISVDSDPRPVPDAVKELGMTYPVVLADDIPDIREKYQFDSIPQLYVIDKQGHVAQTVNGAGEDIEPLVTPLLSE